MGGTHSQKIWQLSIGIWNLLIDNNIYISVFHIPGIDNTLANHCSHLTNKNDYTLYWDGFKLSLSFLPFQPKIDIFASRLTTKLPLYISWHADPYAWKIDALSCEWPDNAYLFPPINLIGKAVHKFIQDELNYGVIINPAWSGLSTLPSIISLLFTDPIFIPSTCLEGSLPARHPFNLMAWPISNLAAQTKAYWQKPQLKSYLVLPPLLSVHINVTGRAL